MNTTLIIVLAAGGAVLLFSADGPKREVTEFDKLKAKVTLLEGRIDQLEARIAALSQARRIEFTPAERPPLFSPSAEGTVPPNIGEVEVNGLKVYKVPLSQAK